MLNQTMGLFGEQPQVKPIQAVPVPAVSVCPSCEKSKANPHCGLYNLFCLACCARLVVNARGCKAAQEGHLDAITRLKKAPKREAILGFIKSRGL